jgi:hypothetical protein
LILKIDQNVSEAKATTKTTLPPAVAEAKLPLAAEAEVEVEVKGTTTLPPAVV